MKTLRKATEIGKTVGTWTVIAFSLVAFMVLTFFAAGGPAIFASDCQGSRSLEVGSSTTFWDIAEANYHDSDPRPIVDEMIAMNGGSNSLQGKRTVTGPC